MNRIKKIGVVILGIAITGLSISLFLSPNKIVSGGVSGIATLIYHISGVPTGVSIAIINVVLLLFGIKILGKKFICYTLFGAGLLSMFVSIFSLLPPITEDRYLASLFGGILYGFGSGITFSVNASSGGCDILSRIIQHRFQNFDVGKCLLVVNGCVVIASLITFKEIELALLGILSLFISSFAIDWFISKLNSSIIAFVITAKGKEVSQELLFNSQRTVTMLDATGAYTSKNKNFLFCAIKNNEVYSFENKILSIDKTAFIVYSESLKIRGRGFHIYK